MKSATDYMICWNPGTDEIELIRHSEEGGRGFAQLRIAKFRHGRTADIALSYQGCARPFRQSRGVVAERDGSEKPRGGSMSRLKQRIKNRLHAGCASPPYAPQSDADRPHDDETHSRDRDALPPTLLLQLLARSGKPPARKR